MSRLHILLIPCFVSTRPDSYFNIYRPDGQKTSVYWGNPRSALATSFGGFEKSFGSLTTSGGDDSNDIIEETRSQSEYLKNLLWTVSRKKETAEILNKVINDENNICLTSVEEAMLAIETSTKLVENAGPEIKKLIKTVKAMENLTDTIEAVREAADILRILELLIPKIAPASPSICQASNAQAFDSLRSLATLIDELSSNQTLFLAPNIRKELKTSAIIISGVTTFLTQLNKAFSKFDKFCTADREYNIEAITAIGEMINQLADLFGVLGGPRDASQMRKQANFTKKIVDNLYKIGDLGLGTLDCNTPGSFKVAADTLDELAVLIEEVGIEELAEQLGIDLDFTF